jgi:formate dehydrogenase subunit gamma
MERRAERRARERNHRARYRHLEGAALPILLASQETFGCVPEEAVALVADALNLSRAEIHGTVTFYHDFRKEPPGKRVLRLCRAESCQVAAMRSPGRPKRSSAAMEMSFQGT